MSAHPMEHTLVYRLWQLPFASRKLEPLLRHVDISKVRRVLDVGCGPGTNAAYFMHCHYHGVDINPRYVQSAERRFGPHFQVADVTTMPLAAESVFDCILINSLLHHLPDAQVELLLERIARLLAPDGAVHILDLVLPEHRSLARFLTRSDRGDYPRSLVSLQVLFSRHFSVKVFEPYTLSMAGITLWHMIYCQGRRQ